MVDALATRISSFPGQAHRVRCFAHVVNLVAKSLLKQFEPAKKSTSDTSGDDGETFLIDFTEGIDLEDAETTAPEDDLDSNQDKDNTDGFINELTEMDAFEREAFELETKPVRTALLKVFS